MVADVAKLAVARRLLHRRDRHRPRGVSLWPRRVPAAGVASAARALGQHGEASGGGFRRIFVDPPAPASSTGAGHADPRQRHAGRLGGPRDAATMARYSQAAPT